MYPQKKENINKIVLTVFRKNHLKNSYYILFKIFLCS